MRRAILFDVRNGGIVRYPAGSRGEWGVVCKGRGPHRPGWKIIDFWWSRNDRRWVPDIAEVDVLPEHAVSV